MLDCQRLLTLSNGGLKEPAMLKIAAPFPQVGSYALLVDDLQPVEQQRAELVRIMRRPTICTRGGDVAVAFPLRTGASGSMLVDDNRLIDATPLTKAEEREMHDISRALAGRERPSRKQRELAARGEALRQRHIMSTVMEIELTKLAHIQARQQPSTGSHLPSEIAA